MNRNWILSWIVSALALAVTVFNSLRKPSTRLLAHTKSTGLSVSYYATIVLHNVHGIPVINDDGTDADEEEDDINIPDDNARRASKRRASQNASYQQFFDNESDENEEEERDLQQNENDTEFLADLREAGFTVSAHLVGFKAPRFKKEEIERNQDILQKGLRITLKKVDFHGSLAYCAYTAQGRKIRLGYLAKEDVTLLNEVDETEAVVTEVYPDSKDREKRIYSLRKYGAVGLLVQSPGDM